MEIPDIVKKRVSTIPEEKIREDWTAALVDIAVCETALAAGIQEYSGKFSVLERLNDNKQHIEVMRWELERRAELLIKDEQTT